MSFRGASKQLHSSEIIFEDIDFVHNSTSRINLLILYQMPEIVPFVSLLRCTFTNNNSGSFQLLSSSDVSYAIARCKNNTLPENLIAGSILNIDGQSY